MLHILYAQGFASNTYVFGFGFIVVNRFYDSCFLSHFYNSICELNYSMLFSLLGFFAVKTVVVCSSCWLNTLILFYCRIIFVMCCSVFLFCYFELISFQCRFWLYSVARLFQYRFFHQNIRTRLNLPWMRVYQSIRFSFAYAHTWYLRGLLRSFIHLIVIASIFLKIYTSLFRISPLLASQSRICFNYYHILYSVSYVFSSPAAFLISVL